MLSIHKSILNTYTKSGEIIIMRQVQHKISPINLRALPSQRDLIDKAASISNKSRSDFMLEVACKEAENILLNQRLFFTDKETYEAFILLLESPIEENLGLKALLKSDSPWEK